MNERGRPGLRIKRIHDPVEPGDGLRVLVDRVWPRGVSKEEAQLDEWAKELAPSTELRRWFGHDPDKWGGFRQRYRAELQSSEKERKMEELARATGSGGVTLLYAAKDREHNNAAALRDFLAGKMED
ncbi:DUF488 domain-containing protein [Desulfohalovibrio reitneri]|uniref:DUF488 domain-containing protein n=1 Tax=Desulfohalovibrio reitneri TaxID=1307759 RepID=UPI0004A6BE1B|nr:DUF488 domain-containing protein [Desulfohalovibrio reitneri]